MFSISFFISANVFIEKFPPEIDILPANYGGKFDNHLVKKLGLWPWDVCLYIYKRRRWRAAGTSTRPPLSEPD